MRQEKTSPSKLYPNVASAVVEAARAIFEDGRYADKVIAQVLRSNPKWGARDRAFIAENTYELVRWYRLLHESLGRVPQIQADWWALFGTRLLLAGQSLPPWPEFAGLDPAAIRERYETARRQRAIGESIPDWLDNMGERQLGSDWPAALHALNQPARVTLRVNLLKTSVEELRHRLLADGVTTTYLGEATLLVKERRNLFAIKAFQEGWFEVQDFSSQQVAPFLEVSSGMRVVDACAGAGGKTLHMAALMKNQGHIIALDTESWKLEELRRRARRAGVHIIQTRPITNAKVIKRLHGSADRLLLDAPCSGLGVLRRNPDAKWKLSPAFIEQVRETQLRILNEYALICRPGARMVYATCSILPEENERQIARFLDLRGRQFTLLRERHLRPQDAGFDGFYMALLERNE
jgi:16S rRNA (cytosine967-C5)-methyltransferase